MKKIFMPFVATLCCGIAMLLTACGSSTNYPTSYFYEVDQDIQYLCYDIYEASDIQNAFDKAIGYEGNMAVAHQTPQDEQMKAACEAVQKQYAGAKSIYLKYDLYRLTSSAEPGATKKKEIIGSYTMGQSLTKPYSYYKIQNNEDVAYDALKAQKESLDENVYKASYRTLLHLLGIHYASSGASFTAESVFDTRFRGLFNVAEDVPEFDNYVVTVCDSIANACASDTLTVEAKVQIIKYQFLKEGQTEIWNHTFEPNIQ